MSKAVPSASSLPDQSFCEGSGQSGIQAGLSPGEGSGQASPVVDTSRQPQHPHPPILLFTDGAASGNPGPGGYGVILRCGTYEKEFSGGFARTTNNRMELLAVIVGLEAIRWEGAVVDVYSDSSYVVKAVNEGWLLEWERKHFAKKKNPDLWQRFFTVYRRHRVRFHWVKGHAGHPENERCDALAVAAGAGAAARGVLLPEDEGYQAETSLF